MSGSTRQILTGNEAVALGALRAGVKVVTGYPGTPSTGCLTHLLLLDLPDRHVEWSVNEKVAFEIAAGAAWAGRRALVAMKMSGLNVAYDAVISIAYSGTNGGLVIYVADDPGVQAGMAEQDSRGFALMSDLPMLEPASVADAYRLVQIAFELSEAAKTPVFVRLTTAVALAAVALEVEEPMSPKDVRPILERDIARYTKAGAAICQRQHRDLIARLEKAGEFIAGRGLHRLDLSRTPGRLGIVACGGVGAYVEEAQGLQGARDDRTAGSNETDVSVLRPVCTVPFPRAEVHELLQHCGSILVLEELEPYFERQLYVEARKVGFTGRIVGKLDGTLSPIGEYGIAEIMRGVEACGLSSVARGETPQATSHDPQAAGVLPAPRPITVCAGVGRPPAADDLTGEPSATVLSSADLAALRPITVCAGCPHRGTYLAIEAAIKRAGFKKGEVMVTGDIGCTILGMNPPFDLLWNEVSMGSSVSLAQGYVYAGVTTPVVATIGDSTFFHGGIPGLVNAIQHRAALTLVVMDNGWTAMTGMQADPGTDEAFQGGGRRVDLEQVIRGLGPDRFEIVDPYDLEGSTGVLAECLVEDGVKVVLAQRECAIQAARRGITYGKVTVDPEKCVLCKRCLQVTGCPALGCSSADAEEQLGEPAKGRAGSPGGRAIEVDQSLCNGCGLCVAFCPTSALKKEAAR